MKATGELLKNYRIDKNLTLEELSAQTKIQVSILKKIEEGLVSQLPNKTVVRGFIKHYAKAMHCNVDEIIALYDSEVSAGPRPTPVTVAVPNKSSDPAQNTIGNKTNLLWFRTSSTFVTILGIGIVVLLIAAIYFFSVKMISYSEETYRKSETTADTPTPAELGVLVMPPQEKKNPVQNSTPLATQSDSKLTNTEQEKKPESDKKNETKADPKDDEEEVKDDSIVATPKMVIVEAFENVNITASWSTGKKEKLALKINKKHTFYYSEKMTLKIDNGGGVNIVTTKGKLGIPGELGQEVTLPFE